MSDQVQAVIYVTNELVTLVVDPGDGELMSREFVISEWIGEYINPIAEHISAVISRLMSSGIMPLVRIRTKDQSQDQNARMLVTLMGMQADNISPKPQLN